MATDALAPQTFCDVCEEPRTGLAPAKFHPGVMLCADCLEGELEVVADLGLDCDA